MTITQILNRIHASVAAKECEGLAKLSQHIDDMLIPQEDKDALNGMVDLALQLIEAQDELDSLDD
jgi:hypothetical protein